MNDSGQKKPTIGSFERNKPKTGEMGKRSRRGRTMVKPDICNINPADLDEETLRNMHAIGVDFAMKKINRLKPFES